MDTPGPLVSWELFLKLTLGLAKFKSTGKQGYHHIPNVCDTNPFLLYKFNIYIMLKSISHVYRI